jgi:Flp pilus assembly protein TadD
MTIICLVSSVAVAITSLSTAQSARADRDVRFQVEQSSSQDAGDLVRQAQQKLRDGKPDEAVSILREAVHASPRSFAANSQLGIALDFTGNYAEARAQFTKAIELAATPQQKAQAQRSMAMSYAFEADCPDAAKYETPVYEMYLADKDFFDAGEVANELARVCLDAGNLAEAAKWYQTGHDVGLREPDIKPDRKDLWEFRWEHAQARIAARRGNKAEAERHIAAAKAILDRGTNPQQAQFFPYLVGYVALYTGDAGTALAELQKANQSDPFIVCLMGEAYEKLGQKEQAAAAYKKASTLSTAHNPPNAYARRLTRKKIS